MAKDATIKRFASTGGLIVMILGGFWGIMEWSIVPSVTVRLEKLFVLQKEYKGHVAAFKGHETRDQATRLRIDRVDDTQSKAMADFAKQLGQIHGSVGYMKGAMKRIEAKY